MNIKIREKILWHIAITLNVFTISVLGLMWIYDGVIMTIDQKKDVFVIVFVIVFASNVISGLIMNA